MIENCIKGTVKRQSSAPYHGRSLRGTSNVGYNTNKGNTYKDNHKNTGPSTSVARRPSYNCHKVYFPGHKCTRPQCYLVVGDQEEDNEPKPKQNRSSSLLHKNQKINKFLFMLLMERKAFVDSKKKVQNKEYSTPSWYQSTHNFLSQSFVKQLNSNHKTASEWHQHSMWS